jgi:hypothetical protein
MPPKTTTKKASAAGADIQSLAAELRLVVQN